MSKWPNFLLLNPLQRLKVSHCEQGQIVKSLPRDPHHIAFARASLSRCEKNPTASHSGNRITSLCLLQLSFSVLLFHIKYQVVFLTSFSALVKQKQGKQLMCHQPTPSVSQENILQFPTNQGTSVWKLFHFL